MSATLSRLVNMGSGTGGSGQTGIVPYPHPAFSLSTYYQPLTVKTLYPWCRYIFTTIPTIYSSIKKKAAYIATDLVFKGSDKAKKEWENLFDTIIKFRRLQKRIYYNLEIYGFVPVSIVFPYDRWFRCTRCGNDQLAKGVKDWKYSNGQFYATCNTCKTTTKQESTMVKSTDIKRTRVKIWRPEQIDVDFNPITDERTYVYNIPEEIRKKVKDEKYNYMVVNNTPDIFLEAIQANKNIELASDNLYVFDVASPTHDDEAFPIPPMLYLFKTAWLYMMINRAQEGVAAEHILPMRVLSPRMGNDVSPQSEINLFNWAMRGQQMVERWRQDPNVIHFSAFPMDLTTVGGDAKVLGMENVLDYLRQNIAAAEDLPIQLLTGDMNYTGGSINLRVLENQFRDIILDMQEFITTFLVPKLQAFFALPNIEVEFSDFKMGDDPQQKSIMLQLATSRYVSVESLLEKLNIDPQKERDRIKNEDKERLEDLRMQQRSQHEVEGEGQRDLAIINGDTQIIAAVSQAIAQLAARQVMEAGMMDPEEINSKVQEIVSGLNTNIKPFVSDATKQYNSYLMDAKIHRFMKETPDHLKEQELARISKSNPDMAMAITKKMQDIRQLAASVSRDPGVGAQKPPASGGGGMQPQVSRNWMG